MRRSGGSFFVAFRVFVAFMGHWGWTFVACTVFSLFMECLGWTFVVFMRRSGWSFFVWRLECLQRFGLGLYGVYSVSSVYGALGWVPCGVYCVSSVYEAFGLAFFKIFISICTVFCGVA